MVDSSADPPQRSGSPLAPSLEDLREQMRRAHIDPAEPLGVALLTAVSIAQRAAAVVGGARGLTPDGEAELIRRVADRIALDHRATVRQVVASLRVRSIVGLGFALAALAGVAAGLGFVTGRDIERRLAAATQTGLTAAVAQEPEAAEIALRLLQTTNLVKAWEVCQSNTTQQQGRSACALPVWTTSPAKSPAPLLKDAGR